jgi:hypothetical protein
MAKKWLPMRRWNPLDNPYMTMVRVFFFPFGSPSTAIYFFLARLMKASLPSMAIYFF